MAAPAWPIWPQAGVYRRKVRDLALIIGEVRGADNGPTDHLGRLEMMKKGLFLFAVASAISLIGGCSRAPSPPSFYPVTGQVLLDGKPACFVNVSLTPRDVNDEDTPAATGQTNANGEFSIRSMMGPGYEGALPGEYWVCLSTPRQ